MTVRQVITAHWQLKILSLFFGVLIYVIINRLIEDEFKTQVAIDVVLNKEHASTYHVEHNVHKVEVLFKGPRTLIANLKNRFPTLKLNLDNEMQGGVRVGTHHLELKSSHYPDLPGQVNISFRPSAVEVELFQIYEKQVLVEPVLELETDFDYDVMFVKPQLVKIRGRREIIEDIEQIKTEPIRDKIDYITQNEINNVALQKKIKGVAVMPHPAEVSVVLNLNEKKVEYELPGVRLNILSEPSDDFKVILDKEFVNLTIKGPPRINGKPLKDITAENFMAFVDVRRLPPTDTKQERLRKVIVYSLYHDLIEVSVSPSDVAVTIEPR